MKNTQRIRWPALLIAATLAAVWATHSRADAPAGRYTIANGTVYDTKSNLTWEQDASLDIFSWDQAQARCQTLTLDGGGWRMPSVKELQTLVDETIVDPSIDRTAFPTSAFTRYWTSTRRASNPDHGWLVAFDFGATSTDDAKNPHRVRCVR